MVVCTKVFLLCANISPDLWQSKQAKPSALYSAGLDSPLPSSHSSTSNGTFPLPISFCQNSNLQHTPEVSLGLCKLSPCHPHTAGSILENIHTHTHTFMHRKDVHTYTDIRRHSQTICTDTHRHIHTYTDIRRHSQTTNMHRYT